MNEEYFDFFDERVSKLEKDIEVLVDWLNEVSPEIRELKLKANSPRWDLLGCKPPLYSFLL